jgi:endonuclease III
MSGEFSEVSRRIAAVLHEPRAPYDALPLGNKPDPLDELIFIVLTTMTQYGPMEIFDDLKRAFPSWDGLLGDDADVRLRATIARGGLVNQKAPQILAIARRLKADFGRVTLDPLRELDDAHCETYLCSLPRVGKKVARCVMMYSLGREVLPVDAHVLRVSKRIGLLPETISWAKAHDAIEEVVAPDLRYALHVGLVVHGREVCTYRNPKCQECVLHAEHLCHGLR